MDENYSQKVSVIMAVYNSGQFLEESIESILNQSFKDFELIIIYDKSSDNSRDIIEKYMKNDYRIILIENEKNLGVATARNKGLEIAKGKYIAIMDSDDISLPNRLEKQHSFLENNINCFLVGSGGTIIDENGNYLESIIISEELANNWNPGSIIHSSVMFRNKKIMYREKFFLSEDYDFYLRIASMGFMLKNINENLIKRRMRHSSLAWTNRKKSKLFEDKALNFYLQRIETGTDDYDIFNEKEILEVSYEEDVRKTYLKYVIGQSLKNENIKEAKQFFKEYKTKISLNRKICYLIALKYPKINKIRLNIKFFIREFKR